MSKKSDLKELLQQLNNLTVNKKKSNNQSVTKTTKLKKTAAERLSKIKQRIFDNKQSTGSSLKIKSKSIKKSKPKVYYTKKNVNENKMEMIKSLIDKNLYKFKMNQINPDKIGSSIRLDTNNENDNIYILIRTVVTNVPFDTKPITITANIISNSNVVLGFSKTICVNGVCFIANINIRYKTNLLDLKDLYRFLKQDIKEHNLDLVSIIS